MTFLATCCRKDHQKKFAWWTTSPLPRRNRWIKLPPFTLHHARTEAAVRKAIQGNRRHYPAKCGQEPRKEAGRQAHAQLILGQEDDRIFLAMTPQGFEHAYQTVAFPVHEFVEGSTRLDQLLHKLAGKLNSNQSFHPDRGLQIDMVYVRMPAPGSGRKKYNVDLRTMDEDSRRKQSIIRIEDRARCQS